MSTRVSRARFDDLRGFALLLGIEPSEAARRALEYGTFLLQREVTQFRDRLVILRAGKGCDFIVHARLSDGVELLTELNTLLARFPRPRVQENEE